MKPRPTAPKDKRTDNADGPAPAPAAKPEPRVPTRTIFVKDQRQSMEGYAYFEEADRERKALGPDDDRRRVRVLYRKRTNKWDVVVKVARQVPIVEQRAIGE